MNTTNARPPVTQSLATRDLPRASHEAGELVALGRAHYWPFHVLGRAPMLQEPVRLGDWLLVPAQDDSTAIPTRAMARIQAIFAAGIRPQGFVLVHEAPKLLKAPVSAAERPQPQNAIPFQTTSVPQSTSDFATALGAGITALASLFFPMMFLVVAVAMADPILVAVTEDGYWIEIDRWYTE